MSSIVHTYLNGSTNATTPVHLVLFFDLLLVFVVPFYSMMMLFVILSDTSSLGSEFNQTFSESVTCSTKYTAILLANFITGISSIILFYFFRPLHISVLFLFLFVVWNFFILIEFLTSACSLYPLLPLLRFIGAIVVMIRVLIQLIDSSWTLRRASADGRSVNNSTQLQMAQTGTALEALQRHNAWINEPSSPSSKGGVRCSICLETLHGQPHAEETKEDSSSAPFSSYSSFSSSSSSSSTVSVLSCGHSYHSACIRQWIDTKRSNGEVPDCVICRCKI